LDDEMLGNKVNVFFKADRIENNGRYDYKNVAVIGDVLVHSDTVAYTVPSIAIDVYPNGTSSSNADVDPYIGFTVDGEEYVIKPSAAANVPEVKKKDDYQNASAKAFQDEIKKYAYILDGAVDKDGKLDYLASNPQVSANDPLDPTKTVAKYADDAFYANVGVDRYGDVNLDTYRFISVDGGLSYSYMIKTHANKANINYGAVTAYNEARGTMRLSGISGVTNLDLDEVVLVDEIAVDDTVVVYRENGKIYIEKVEVMTGAVESFGDDGSIVINGNPYWAWNANNFENSISATETAFDYYKNYKSAMGANTTYYVFGSIIMDIEANADAVTTIENYAVILRSWLDEDMGTAYVTLGFADGTEGSYQVGKLYTVNAAKPNDPTNDLAKDFANNAMFGLVVNYKIRDNGTLDLSGQYFKQSDNKKTTLRSFNTGATTVAKIVNEKQFQGKYALNDSTILFALYGNPYYTTDGQSNIKVDSTQPNKEVCGVCGQAICAVTDPAHTREAIGFTPVKAKAYKLADLKYLDANPIPNLMMVGHHSGATGGNVVGSYIVNSATANTSYIVAAAVTVGADVSLGNATYKDTKDYAYVVSAKEIHNFATDYSYAELTVINKEGVQNLTTIENVTNFNSVEQLTGDRTQKLDGKQGPKWNGDVITYETNADGVVTMLSHETPDTVYDQSADGFYYVTIAGERNDILSFYQYSTNDQAIISTVPTSCEYHEDGYSIIGINEEDFAGDYLTIVSDREDKVAAKTANAIIQVYEGQIKTVFSFTDTLQF
ncbi:MAG: hypothetical protein II996_03325, partial [Oscillospiraceae bacterium]|nr:hypothetical protein [Oscillospiraceae bacterium]